MRTVRRGLDFGTELLEALKADETIIVLQDGLHVAMLELAKAYAGPPAVISSWTHELPDRMFVQPHDHTRQRLNAAVGLIGVEHLTRVLYVAGDEYGPLSLVVRWAGGVCLPVPLGRGVLELANVLSDFRPTTIVWMPKVARWALRREAVIRHREIKCIILPVACETLQEEDAALLRAVFPEAQHFAWLGIPGLGVISGGIQPVGDLTCAGTLADGVSVRISASGEVEAKSAWGATQMIVAPAGDDGARIAPYTPGWVRTGFAGTTRGPLLYVTGGMSK